MPIRLDPQELRRVLEKGDRPGTATGPARRPAAVFALLVNRDETNLLLIRRADLGDLWSGQIALPGGHLDPTDADPLAAAYRETGEEVGIKPEAVTYLGELGDFQTQIRSVVVRVFVGLWDGVERPQADPAEVAGVFEVSLSHLLAEHRRQGFHLHAVEELGDRLIYPLRSPAPRGDGSAAPRGDEAPGSSLREDGAPTAALEGDGAPGALREGGSLRDGAPNDAIWGVTARIIHHLLGLVGQLASTAANGAG